MTTVIEEGTVFLGRRDLPNERIAFFPTLLQRQSGDRFCIFQVGAAKNSPQAELGLCRARPGALQWERLPNLTSPKWNERPGSLCIGSLAESEDGRLCLFATWYDRSDPQRPLFDPETEGILHARLLATYSSDDGQTWSPWATIDTGTITGCALTGPTLRWLDGSVAVPFESFKHFDDLSKKNHAAWVCPIVNGHVSMVDHIHFVAGDPTGRVSYWDQRLAPLSVSGRYLALFWTHDRVLQRDLNVHCKMSNTSKSDPSSPVSTGISGQIAAPLALTDTHFLALVVDRNGADPGIVLYQSLDTGHSWLDCAPLKIYHHRETAHISQSAENVDYAKYWEDMGKWSFGHPALLRLANNEVIAVYYAGTPDHMGIRYAHIRI